MEHERDVHALLELGVPLSKLEQLYGTGARAAAHTFVTGSSAGEGRLRVGSEVLKRSPSTKELARANPQFVQSLLDSLAEEPEEMLMDTIQMIPLKDPVVLSTGFVVDRSTALKNGRLRLESCPFSRKRLELEVYPLHMLRKMVVEWRLKQLGRCLQLAEIFVEAGQWPHAESIFQKAEDFLDDLNDGTYLHVAQQLATLERHAPQISATRAAQNYKRLCAVATPVERQRLLREAAEEGLREATALLNTVDQDVFSAAGGDSPPIAESRAWKQAREWLAMHAWLTVENGMREDLRVAWGEQLLRAAKVAGLELEARRWGRYTYRLLATASAPSATGMTNLRLLQFLARWGFSEDPSFLGVGPPFDPWSGWQRFGEPETGITASGGRVSVGPDESGASLAYEYVGDLSPRNGCDWMLEVVFAAEGLNPHSYDNSIFSQHGVGTGWELRADPGRVEVVFTTEYGGHNEFSFTRPINMRPGEWTHCLVCFQRSTEPSEGGGNVSLFVDGMAPETVVVHGEFVPCSLPPMLGMNPQWHDRAIVSRVHTRARECLC